MARPPVQLQLTPVDHPEIGETFVDSMEQIFCDDATIRMTFAVHRFDEPKPPLPPTGKKHTACRLVMAVQGLPHFVNQLNKIMGALAQQGAVQIVPPSGGQKPN